MKKRTLLTFETIPDWAIDQHNRSRHTIAPALQLAGLWAKHCRLTADTQRKLFGAVLFGKCEIFADDIGIRSYRKVCFGTDFSSVTLTWDRVEAAVANGRKVCV
jgi:hypothetical protein